MMFESINGGQFLAHAGEGRWGWHDMMGFGWFGVFGMLFMVIFWVAVIVGVVWLVRWLLNQGSSGPRARTSKERALEILDEKYARGEIDDEEYERRKRKLLEG